MRKKHVNVFDVTMTNALREVAEGRVKIKTVGELISLIKARWNLADTGTPSATPTMHFNGPTQVDLGLERMGREEKIKFIKDTLQGIIRVQARPPIGIGLNRSKDAEEAREVVHAPVLAGASMKAAQNFFAVRFHILRLARIVGKTSLFPEPWHN